MPLDVIMVIMAVLDTTVNIMVLDIEGITVMSINSIRENIMITIATDLGTVSLDVMGLITIEIMGAIDLIIIPAFRASLFI